MSEKRKFIVEKRKFIVLEIGAVDTYASLEAARAAAKYAAKTTGQTQFICEILSAFKSERVVTEESLGLNEEESE